MRRRPFIPDWKGIVAFVRDPKTDWKPKALVVLAVVYLVWPIDLIPDFLPIIGWLEDIGFSGVAVWYVCHATNRYLESRQ